MNVEELIIKTKSSESKWKLVEVLRNNVLDSNYVHNGIVLNVDDLRRIIIFYPVDTYSLRAMELIRNYMAGPGSEFGQVIL